MSKTPSISMNVTVKATPTEVFAALTNSKAILEWCGQKGKVEAKIGGRFEMFDGWVKGKVLAYEPGKSLAYTWHPTDWQKEWDASIVKYAFTKTKSGTKISLKHSGFPNEQEMKGHHSGWTEHVFDPLKEFFKV
jgi:uncharacterized protein YndB with AHSA1/START domain